MGWSRRWQRIFEFEIVFLSRKGAKLAKDFKVMLEARNGHSSAACLKIPVVSFASFGAPGKVWLVLLIESIDHEYCSFVM
jgi:hypothetical protein